MADFLMPLRSLFEYVDAIPSSIALRESQYAWAWVTVSHVMSMCLFAGTIIMMDVRLVGLGNMDTPFSQVQRRLFPWQIVGMTLSTISGLALVFAQPLKFYDNIFFWGKMVMMLLAGVNALAFHYIAYDTVRVWDTKAVTPYPARLAGAVSLVLWTMIILSGRLIPYGDTWF